MMATRPKIDCVGNRYRGFTLIEAAIAVVISAVLMAGAMNVMSTSSDVRKYKSTQNQLVEVQESLVSYYTQFNYLPCPDTDGDGIQNPATFTGSCTNNRGFLPHVTLGVGGNGDAWGERFKYQVSPPFVQPLATPPTICYSNSMRDATGKLTLNDLSTPTNLVSDFAAFVVLSTGKNGRQTNSGMTSAFSNNGGCLVLNALEQENCDNDAQFRIGMPMTDASGIVFDDMLTWIGDMQLVSILRQTGICDVSTDSVGFDPSQKTNTDFTTGAAVHSGSYENGSWWWDSDDYIATSNASDKVVINGNLNKDLDLGGGNNTLLVNGNMTNYGYANFLTAGSGNDIVRFTGNVYELIDLGAGNDQLEIEGGVDVNSFDYFNIEEINMGSGDDQVRIYGSVRDTDIKLGSGKNTIYIGGTIIDDVRITAEGGTGVLYYNASTKPKSSALTLGSTVTIQCRINNAWANCP